MLQYATRASGVLLVVRTLRNIEGNAETTRNEWVITDYVSTYSEGKTLVELEEAGGTINVARNRP
jgi:hypothetical protein